MSEPDPGPDPSTVVDMTLVGHLTVTCPIEDCWEQIDIPIFAGIRPHPYTEGVGTNASVVHSSDLSDVWMHAWTAHPGLIDG